MKFSNQAVKICILFGFINFDQTNAINLRGRLRDDDGDHLWESSLAGIDI